MYTRSHAGKLPDGPTGMRFAPAPHTGGAGAYFCVMLWAADESDVGVTVAVPVFAGDHAGVVDAFGLRAIRLRNVECGNDAGGIARKAVIVVLPRRVIPRDLAL